MSRFTCAAVLLAALSAACSNSPTVTTPTPTTPVYVTDTFAGTLTRNGATTFPFSVSTQGAVTANLTSVGDASLTIGMSLGSWNGTACNILLANDQAKQGVTMVGTASGIGTLCLRVYDVGQVTTPVDYTVTVTHP